MATHNLLYIVVLRQPLNVNDPGNLKFTVAYSPTRTVHALKLEICQVSGHSMDEHMRLVWAGKHLSLMDCKLEDYGLSRECTIYVLLGLP